MLPWGLIGLVVVAAGLWAASLRRPVDLSRPLETTGAVQSSLPNSRPVEVGVFNIHGCKGTDRKRDLKRVADCLHGLDIVALHEVRGGYATNQADELGRNLEMASLFAPTEWRWGRNDFGNGLLTKIRLGGIQQIPLAMTEHTYRNALLTRFQYGDQTVQLLVVHIDLLADRDRQFQAVADLFCSLTAPAILMGDLNVDADHPGLRALLAKPGIHNALAAAPANKGDWIIAKGMTAVSARVEPNDASDHPVIRASLVLNDPSMAGRSSRKGVRR